VSRRRSPHTVWRIGAIRQVAASLRSRSPASSYWPLGVACEWRLGDTRDCTGTRGPPVRDDKHANRTQELDWVVSDADNERSRHNAGDAFHDRSHLRVRLVARRHDARARTRRRHQRRRTHHERARARQCGRNVFPVSRSVFNRERIRGHPSAFSVYAGSSSAHSSFATTTFTASVS